MYRALIVILALWAALALGGARTAAAEPCAGALLAAPTERLGVLTISDTLQPATNLFVCRVDGAGAPATGAPPGTRSLTPAGLALLVAARWLHFLGYALGFGTISVGLWASAALAEQPERWRRLWRLVSVGLVLLLCAEPLALLAQTIGLRGALLDPGLAGEVLASGFGLVWAQRVGLALLLWVVAGVVKDGRPRALWLVPALGLVLALVDAQAGGRGVTAVVAAALHQAAMGAWVGGLALLMALWTQLDGVQQAAQLARFRWLCVASIAVLLLSGVALAGAPLAQPAALFASLYGFVLVAKLLGALAAIGLAAAAWRAYLARWRWRASLAALVIVLGLAGLLVSLPAPWG